MPVWPHLDRRVSTPNVLWTAFFLALLLHFLGGRWLSQYYAERPAPPKYEPIELVQVPTPSRRMKPVVKTSRSPEEQSKSPARFSSEFRNRVAKETQRNGSLTKQSTGSGLKISDLMPYGGNPYT